MLQLLKIVFTFGKELLIALCQSLISNVNPALLNLQSGAEDIDRPDFAWLFFNQFFAQKMSDSRENEEF